MEWSASGPHAAGQRSDFRRAKLGASASAGSGSRRAATPLVTFVATYFVHADSLCAHPACKDSTPIQGPLWTHDEMHWKSRATR